MPGQSPLLQGFPQTAAPFVNPQSGFMTQPWYQFMVSLWQRTGTAQGGNIVPTGSITMFAAASLPTGWAVCDGSPVSRVVYAALYSVIGNTWGDGDGSTTFNLPAFGGRFPMGAGNVPVGNRGGSNSVTLTVGNLPAHTHSAPELASNVTTGTSPGGVVAGDTGSTGSGDPISVLPRFAAVRFIIKT